MTLIRYRPLSDVVDRRQWSDRLARAWSGQAADEGDQGFVPAIDIQESVDEFTLFVEVPGVDPEAINIRVTGDVLTLEGEKRLPADGDVTWQHAERRFGSFTRSFQLTTPIDTQKVAADSKHGVLRISLPKADVARTRKIPINA